MNTKLAERHASAEYGVSMALRGEYNFRECASRRTGEVQLEDAAAAFTEARGVVRDAAALIGVPEADLRRALARWPELRDVQQAQREHLLDIAEKRLAEAVEEGDMSSVKYVLNSLGRQRGYGTKVQVESGVSDELLAAISAANESHREFVDAETIEVEND